jgi:phospholipase D1/2
MTFNGRNALKAAIVLFIAAVVAALYFTPARQYMTREHIGEGVSIMRGLWYGPVILVLAYAIGCIFAVPASLFIIASGVVWGWKLGGLYAMTGGMLGAVVSYFIGRFLGEGMLEKFGSAGRMVERQVSSAGLKTMFIVRLIPGPPFAVWNYGAGVARVKFSDYFLGTLLGTFPAHMIFAYSADALFNGTMTQGDAVRRLFIVAGLMLALTLLPSLIKRFTRPEPTV